jgi:hypothetical protein
MAPRADQRAWRLPKIFLRMFLPGVKARGSSARSHYIDCSMPWRMIGFCITMHYTALQREARVWSVN